VTQVQWIDRVVKPLLFAACLVPAALLLSDFLRDNLSANPIEEITHRTGDWTLRLLLVALAVTPLRRVTGVNGLIRLRRMLGLFAFTYALLHFSTYIVLDQFFALDAIVEDVAKRPYITVGFTGFCLLIPLAVTSTKGWVRRLGGNRWGALHRLVYVAAAGGVLHYLWLVKGNQAAPVYYAGILVVLLAFRVWAGRTRPRGARPQEAATAARTPAEMAS
jgi:sulfoxide reductase heme-binding subunit YedZ